MESRLSPIQREVLEILAPLSPRWTLTGGGALAGFYLGHRITHDVDLFFHGLTALERLPDEAIAALLHRGLGARTVQRGAAFCRLEADSGAERLLIDLVAEPVANVFPMESVQVGAAEILIDSRAEILVNKLGALYSRSEIRDLVDVQALIAAGEDLDAALRLVIHKDGGFSPPTLAWVLQSLPVRALARADGYDPGPLVAFRDDLVARLLG